MKALRGWLAAALAAFALLCVLGLGKEFDAFPNGPAKGGFFVEFDTDEDLSAFVATAIAGGGASVSDAVSSGAAVLSGAATTDDSGVEMQRDAATVQFETGKRTRLLFRLKVSDATQSDLRVGLATLDTSLIASAPTDAVWFSKDDGDALLDLNVRAAGADVTTTAGAYTLANDTWTRLAIDVNMSATANRGTVTFYVDGASVASSVISGLPSGVMSASVAIQSGDATGTKTATVEYLGVEQGR